MGKSLEVSVEEMKALLDNAPTHCLITGLKKCESYMIDGNVVYLPKPAYDAYTLPQYDADERAFYRTRYDMDNNFLEEVEHVCDLEDLENSPNIEKIRAFYKIS